jgi:hypothetical protein
MVLSERVPWRQQPAEASQPGARNAAGLILGGAGCKYLEGRRWGYCPVWTSARVGSSCQ